MAKVFVPQSSCIFAVTIFVLLILSVGLLVFVLKGQIHHENSVSSKDDHAKVSSVIPKRSTHTPSPQTAPKPQATRSTAGQTEVGHTTESSKPEKNPWEDFRLPKYITPLHYDLVLHPNIQNDTFTGSVNITVNVTKSANFFVVHAYRLVVKESKVFEYQTDAEIGVVRSFLYDPHEYFVIETEKEVEPGIYKLSYTFFGSLVGSIVGFYKSRYTDRNNQTRYLATSKFQPTYARRAFPCYDEPSFKSTFTVSLVHEPGYSALSNMPVDETKPYLDTQLLVTKFQTSVPMVTYLACFIVCDFDYVRTTTSAGKEFRVYAAPDQINKTEYALNFGSRVLEYFENYFGIDYPLPKQDMVAIPDFVSGAMEHWGVITFRETNLLYDNENSSPQNKQRVSTVISHEMTHMWFGNLVTMEWWDDLWLNEGFASYVEYKGVHEQHPEWDILSQFVTEDVQPVMDLDSTMSSHPIVQPVTHPDEITEIFDDISYGKGASVLRMLEFFVGKDNFQRGISQFLKKYQFKNAKTADLWAELSEACGYQGNHTIASVMKTWTEQMGFPFITVRRLRSDQNTSVFVAKQERFVKNEALYRSLNSTNDYIWSVPLSYVTENGQTDIIWIHDENEMEFVVPAKETDWIKFNVNQTGYYLVNYERQDWDRLTDVLLTNHELLTPADRSNLLFDTFLLGEAGHIPFDVFLSMSKYLKNETHLIPWETAYHSFVYLCQLLEYTEVNFLLKNYINDLTDERYKNLGWKASENHLDNLLRTTIIGLACHSGNKECLSDAAQLFQNWTQGQEIPSSLRSLVYHYGMSEIGQEEHWNYMWNKYLAEEAPSERKTLLYGLAHVRVPALIHRYLEYAMDDQKIRRQDFFTILNYIAGNPVGRPFVWNFLREKWTTLVDRFTLNDRYLGLAVKKICSYFTSDYELQQMKSFFLKYPDAGAGKRRRQQALENVLNNIKWLKTYKQDVKTWLEIEGTSPWYYHRLPSYIVPKHYDLLFHPRLNQDIFTGRATITVSLTKPSDCFLVHAVKLNVTNSKITFLGDRSPVKIEEMFQFDDNDYLVLKVGRKLQVGIYELYFEFEGPFTVSLKGLYKSTYIDPGTREKRSLATTQFEAISARRAFPCFDEPTFKSTFTVRIRHDSEHFALSNTEVKEIVNLENGLHETRFEKTFPMVTYLLCIIVCDFKHKETFTERGIKLRVYTAPHQIDRVDYALEFGSKILDYYEKYFEVKFPLNKLDMIAIPDFAPGGMENWGLITYAENRLLVSNESSVDAKIRAASLIAHELAHMWFGDLVTMKWWDDLWLNEGFATYMSQKAVKHIEPEFDEENDLFSTAVCIAMSNDQTVNSHPIVQQVMNVKSGILFDSITYSKGSSVLGMLEKYMGEDFRKGVSTYLKKFAFGSARTEDLWGELTSASTEGLNVTLIMETWTKQMNYPYLTVMKENEEGKFVIQQRRFLEDPSTMIYSTNVSPFNYIWQIPITYRSSETGELNHFLLNSSDTVSLNIPDAKWVKFNVNFTGYYSVNYDLRDWKTFVDILKTNYEEFSPSDRINLLFDSFSLATAGNLDFEIPLSMTNYLKDETYYGVWRVAYDNFEQIKRYFKNDRMMKDIIKEYVRSLSKNLLRKYTWMNNTGSYSERRLKRKLIDAACNNGHHECLLTAGNLFNQWKKGTELDSEIRDLVYTYGLRVLNDDSSWEFLFQKYLDESNPDKRGELQNALTLVRNASQIERFIDAARDERAVRKHEYFRVLTAIAKNLRGFSQVTSLIFNNWTNLVKTYGSKETEAFAYSVFALYDSEKDLKKVREFYRKNKVIDKEGQRSRTLAIESILENIRWHEMHKTAVKKWFESNVFMPWRNIRLPRHITPSKYTIMLQPNITQASFDGSEEIAINISEPTDYMLLHEIGLKIFNMQLLSLETGKDVSIDEIFPYKRTNFHVINLKDKVPAGEYVLKLNFSGTFTDGGDGIGRYYYTHREDSSKRYLIASKFEPTDARRMFPSFDEPDKKAKFKLTLIHEDNYTALSNMPIENQTPLTSNMVETVFEESVIMSTYLLCFVISDFDYIETEYKGKKVRVYAAPDRIQEAEHGLNITVKALEKFEDYFDVPYALPKLDSVAIPRYTDAGREHWGVITYNEKTFLVNDSVAIPHYNVPAMEHWGVITYNERNFLVNEDEVESIYSRMISVDRVIAHELAHQWFGNLVTMKWWNDLWLNEGFSTFIMYMPLREYYPADELEVRKVSRMMCTDSSKDSHPIIRNVSNSPDITDLFDNISYEKGSAVLKMLQYTLKDDFRKGLSNYLKKYAFKNAETKDLWDELSNASDMDINISEIMDTWTLQMGFPIVELKRNGDSLTASQRWFLRKKNDTIAALLAQENKLSPFGFVWKIPLIYKNLATGNEHTLWLNERNATFHISAMKTDVLKFNPGFLGYYIVKYDEDDYQRIAKRLLEDHTAFGVIDRYNLLHDAFLLAETDRLLFDIPFEFSKYLKKEKDLMPWALYKDWFMHFLVLMDGNSETVKLLKEYTRELTRGFYDELVSKKHDNSYMKNFGSGSGNCPISFKDTDLSTNIIGLACLSENEKCLKTLSDELQSWIQGKNFTAELHLVLSLAIPYSGNITLWNTLYEKFSDPDTEDDEREDILKSLVYFTGRTEIMKTIDVMMKDPLVNSDMARMMFEKLGDNPAAVPILWNHAKRNWEDLLLRFDSEDNPTAGISIFCEAFKTLRDLGDFIRFLKSVPQMNDYLLQGCIEDIQEAINWSEKHEQTLQNWLRWNVL